MKLSAFSIIWAIIYLGFGLGLLFIPAMFMTTYGVTLDAGGAFMTRLLGSALVAYAFIFYTNRNIPLTDRTQRNIMIGSVVYNLCDTPVVLMATLNGVMSVMGWIPVALHVFLLVSFSYFAFKKV
jgi:hypothetical protein